MSILYHRPSWRPLLCCQYLNNTLINLYVNTLLVDNWLIPTITIIRPSISLSSPKPCHLLISYCPVTLHIYPNPLFNPVQSQTCTCSGGLGYSRLRPKPCLGCTLVSLNSPTPPDLDHFPIVSSVPT